ncbi:hypothetical protein [Frigoribacterium sp. VKM Ac-2530]|uniref:hypothetical protein n=1 Tax=Frigoribacterium sp. VKM Ac-2530 TaxID=2783822 RepID=UPI00188C9600|nr:hypothetical protein [Frigoribacterium sp. VKM Ac-2530]MBF4580781.1 hypothetical protein [Frigoribacterium sp. VKM Ac-2530]
MKSGNHIVFDQYIGQIFNRLTRLELCDAPTNVVDSYLFKLRAQQLHIADRDRSAAALIVLSGMACSVEEREAALLETEEQLLERSRRSVVQEAFAVGHEVMHLVLEYPDLRVLYDDFFHEVLDVARERAKIGLNTEVEASYEADLQAIQVRRGRPVRSADSPRLPLSSLGLETVLLSAFDRHDVRTEAICDLFAALNLRYVLAGQVDMDDGDILATCTLALQHLRMIQYMDNRDSGSDETVGDYATQSAARVTLLRTGLAMALELELTLAGMNPAVVEKEVHLLHQRATVLNRRHTSVVADHLLAISLDRTAESVLGDQSLTSDVDSLATNREALRSLLGFVRRTPAN